MTPTTVYASAGRDAAEADFVAGGTASLYVRLLAASREAFAGGHFAVAYHALAGATHAAVDLGSVERLAQVERLAREQMAWIDAHRPDHHLSTASAARRGTLPLWTLLATEAGMHAHMVRSVASHDGPPGATGGDGDTYPTGRAASRRSAGTVRHGPGRHLIQERGATTP